MLISEHILESHKSKSMIDSISKIISDSNIQKYLDLNNIIKNNNTPLLAKNAGI